MLDTKNPITRFTGEHAFLSNFYPSPIQGKAGIVYPTAEHAFQAAKVKDDDIRREIAALATPGQAKRFGRKVRIEWPGGVAEWNANRLRVMRMVLAVKFPAHDGGNPMSYALDQTGGRRLFEGNDWGDTFWGVVDGEGENWLGQLLMERRLDNRPLVPSLR